jgi:F0F1-type ATP synthase membrane subunit b/b'
MIKDFLVKKMLEKQLAGMPKEQQEMIQKAMKNNPALFDKIAKETEAQVKAGKNQMYAAYEVMKKYQKELQAAITK